MNRLFRPIPKPLQSTLVIIVSIQIEPFANTTSKIIDNVFQIVIYVLKLIQNSQKLFEERVQLLFRFFALMNLYMLTNKLQILRNNPSSETNQKMLRLIKTIIKGSNVLSTIKTLLKPYHVSTIYVEKFPQMKI